MPLLGKLSQNLNLPLNQLLYKLHVISHNFQHFQFSTGRKTNTNLLFLCSIYNWRRISAIAMHSFLHSTFFYSRTWIMGNSSTSCTWTSLKLLSSSVMNHPPIIVSPHLASFSTRHFFFFLSIMGNYNYKYTEAFKPETAAAAVPPRTRKNGQKTKNKGKGWVDVLSFY